MEDLIKYIINSLVDDDESINITTVDDVITVTVPKNQMGKVIGKQGRIAKSIRTILKAAAKDDRRMSLEIVEAE